jgi:hypothetical protein
LRQQQIGLWFKIGYWTDEGDIVLTAVSLFCCLCMPLIGQTAIGIFSCGFFHAHLCPGQVPPFDPAGAAIQRKTAGRCKEVRKRAWVSDDPDRKKLLEMRSIYEKTSGVDTVFSRFLYSEVLSIQSHRK